MEGLFDAAAVISNDTDLVTPIRMVTAERNKPVFIVCPGRWQVAPKLNQAASYVRHIRRSMLKTAQFPDPIPGTGIAKPKTGSGEVVGSTANLTTERLDHQREVTLIPSFTPRSTSNMPKKRKISISDQKEVLDRNAKINLDTVAAHEKLERDLRKLAWKSSQASTWNRLSVGIGPGFTIGTVDGTAGGHIQTVIAGIVAPSPFPRTRRVAEPVSLLQLRALQNAVLLAAITKGAQP